MDESSRNGLGVVLVIALIWLGVTAYNQHQKIEQMTNTISDCSDAVDNANSNIDDLNSQIDDAQSNAWSDYDTMGDTLDGLTQGDDVDNPCYVPDN